MWEGGGALGWYDSVQRGGKREEREETLTNRRQDEKSEERGEWEWRETEKQDIEIF